jgi:hypothetical protein
MASGDIGSRLDRREGVPVHEDRLLFEFLVLGSSATG